jgi:hypothetical protein
MGDTLAEPAVQISRNGLFKEDSPRTVRLSDEDTGVSEEQTTPSL